MPLLERITEKITDRLPSMVSPGLHALADYGTAAGFLLYGMSAWKRDKRVGVSSVGCGLFALMSSALTDYSANATNGLPSGKLPFDSHGRVDLGLAAMVGAMPSFMGLEDKYDARFFRIQAVMIVALAGLTDFSGTGERKQLRRIEKSEKVKRGEALQPRRAA